MASSHSLTHSRCPLFIGVLVVAARIWWSVTAAIVLFAITLAIYVGAVGYMRRHRKTV